LIKFDPLLKLTLNYEDDLERLLEDIAREAFIKGYDEILDLSREVRFISE